VADSGVEQNPAVGGVLAAVHPPPVIVPLPILGGGNGSRSGWSNRLAGASNAKRVTASETTFACTGGAML